MAKEMQGMRAERAFLPPVKCALTLAGRSQFFLSHQGSGLLPAQPAVAKKLEVFRLPASLLLVCKQTDPDYVHHP